MLQIERDRALVRVEHRDRKCRAFAGWRAATQRLALRRFDLDDIGAGLRHQQTRVGALIDLPEIKHRHAGKRPVRPLHYGAPPLYAPLRPSGGEREGPGAKRWEGEVGYASQRTAIPHL